MEKVSDGVSPRAAILIVIVTFVLTLFLGATFLILFGDYFTLVFGELLLIVLPLGYMLSVGVDIKSYIGLNVKPRFILLGVALGTLMLLFDALVSFALTSVFGVSEVTEKTTEMLLNIGSSLEGLIVLVVALSLAGICEEFIFRGFLQNAVNSKHPSGVAILVSSLAFGLFHFDPQAVYTIAGFLMGLMLGFIYHRFHSYVVSTVTHATLNIIVLAIILLT